MGQPGFCLWLTGLPASGKTTLALALADLLPGAFILDGDAVRSGLNQDLGFSPADRKESVRRVSEVARLMADAGRVVIVALISPYRSDRDAARARFKSVGFIEVFIDTPLDVCEARDPKGHYSRARSGQLPNFTGVSSPYEPPVSPEIVIANDGYSSEEHARMVMAYLAARGLARI